MSSNHGGRTDFPAQGAPDERDDERARPCWVVIVRGSPTLLEPAIRRACGLVDRDEDDDDEDDCPWEIRAGSRGHIAVIEYEPGSQGGEEKLAKTLSLATTTPVYALALDDEYPQVQVFERGAFAGDVHASPDAVARQLGCTFSQQEAGGREVDLTPRNPPPAAPGAPTIGRFTAQWRYEMDTSEWQFWLEDADEGIVPALLAWLADPDAQTRGVACELVAACGPSVLGVHATDCLAQLRAVTASDADAGVRELARKVLPDLVEDIEDAALRAELPWLDRWDPERIPDGTAALDDARAYVRFAAARWWCDARELPADVRDRVLAKLAALLAHATDDLERRSFEHASERLRQL